MGIPMESTWCLTMTQWACVPGGESCCTSWALTCCCTWGGPSVTSLLETASGSWHPICFKVSSPVKVSIAWIRVDLRACIVLYCPLKARFSNLSSVLIFFFFQNISSQLCFHFVFVLHLCNIVPCFDVPGWAYAPGLLMTVFLLLLVPLLFCFLATVSMSLPSFIRRQPFAIGICKTNIFTHHIWHCTELQIIGYLWRPIL